jgi:multidrug resistance efflux pump
MSRSARNALVVSLAVVALAAAAVWLYARTAAPRDRLELAGNVRPGVRTVSAPALTYPTPDYTVGIPKPAGAPVSAMASGKKGSGKPSASMGQPVVAGTIATVTVGQGDTVEAGQVVVQLDTTMLDLGVEQARTAAAKARADVRVMAANLDDVDSAKTKLSDARGQLATAKSSLLKARAALTKARRRLLAQQAQLLELKAQRPQLEAALAALKAQAAQFPPGQVPPALAKQIAQLEKVLASIDPGLKGIAAGLEKVDANLAKVNDGLAKLPSASARIVSAAGRLADTKTQLTNARSVLEIVADGQALGVQVAEARRSQATVRSPYAGVVTYVRPAGTVVMVGAPLVRIAESGPQRVDTYLTAEQAAQVRVGSKAEVRYDSAPVGTVLLGRVSEIGSAYVYPPTSFPTQIVHMTRALKATVELDEGDAAPPGTPVDLTIYTR